MPFISTCFLVVPLSPLPPPATCLSSPASSSTSVPQCQLSCPTYLILAILPTICPSKPSIARSNTFLSQSHASCYSLIQTTHQLLRQLLAKLYLDEQMLNLCTFSFSLLFWFGISFGPLRHLQCSFLLFERTISTETNHDSRWLRSIWTFLWALSGPWTNGFQSFKSRQCSSSPSNYPTTSSHPRHCHHPSYSKIGIIALSRIDFMRCFLYRESEASMIPIEAHQGRFHLQ